MDKVLIKFKIPALDEVYDIFVAPELKISTMLPIVLKAIAENSGGKYVISGHEMLSQIDLGRLLNSNYSLNDYGIGDGAYLMLL